MESERFFRLAPSEVKEANKFEKKHKKCGDGKHSFTYSFTCTGIGVSIVIRCKGCYDVKDITDVRTW